MSCREFIASSEQYKRWEERSWQYDYDSLGSGLSDNILCLEDLDLLPLLPNKDFCEFLDFLKIHGNGSRFFLFGDFKSLTATLSIRVKELEMALNVRDFNAEQIFVDEPCILRGMFRMADMRISASAEKILDDAWNYFRQQHREKRVNEVLRTFIEKTRFALLKSGRRDVHAETFDWLGMPKATTPKMRGTSRRFKPQTLRELDNLAGMDKIKAAIERLTAHAFVSKKKAAAGLAVKPHNFSFLFLGNPGTGKTTVARILAETLRELGVLKKGHLVAAHRGNLIAPYLGQTAMLVTETFISALDGVLFVDEAYSLCAESSQDEYGKEAVNTLNLLMSEYAGRIAVIFAGYPKEMEAFLAASNPGLRERFAYKFIFEDYTEEELVEIFSNKLRAAKLALADGGEELVRRKIAKVYKDKDEQFANARVVDNLFQELLQAQEERLASRFYRGLKTGARALTRLTVEDCQKLLESEVGQRFKKERRAVGF
jgi:AAA+ superfamily predicted ATPase